MTFCVYNIFRQQRQTNREKRCWFAADLTVLTLIEGKQFRNSILLDARSEKSILIAKRQKQKAWRLKRDRFLPTPVGTAFRSFRICLKEIHNFGVEEVRRLQHGQKSMFHTAVA